MIFLRCLGINIIFGRVGLGLGMKYVMFNLNDIVLILIVVLCGLLAVSAIAGKKFSYIHKRFSRLLLGGFFAVSAVVAADTLLFWGEGVRSAVFTLSPFLLTLFSFSVFLLGPLLYWFVLSEIGEKDQLDWKSYLHLLPAVATPLYLYWICYRYPVDIQRDLILNLTIYSVPQAHFSTFIAFKKVMPLIYGLMSLTVLMRRGLGESSFSNVKYLIFFSAGFSFIYFWVLITHLLGLWLPTTYSDRMGLLGNYMTLILFFSIVISLFQVSSSNKSKTPSESRSSASSDDYKQSQIIQEFMEKNKPYLNPGLTLDRFSDQISLSPRQVSAAINRCFKRNFQEYINRYRIEEAKRLLKDENYSELTVVQIGVLSGFNSKATFNRLFKSFVSMSPSAYR